MKTTLTVLISALSLALYSAPVSAEEEPVAITEIFKRDHPDQADKDILVKRIVLQPGASAPPHVHPGMVTGYVQSGSLEFQLKDGPLLKLKAGDTFFEPAGSHHILAKSTETEKETIIIAFVINPKGAPLSTPLDGNGKH
ncbi:cupin domain-containing protein [Luteolibacter luteus]|uniref:Cupin domain-containing protein n=1 Tax=Luteolibacter luteus TaxID=2728835 RepID=A0A858RQP1_9BACT|nr:cupin domain-containing protein [Luteolibacter luteus]QJE98669.1 cupin domain-containing protein [Luteolibacter luteus]